MKIISFFVVANCLLVFSSQEANALPPTDIGVCGRDNGPEANPINNSTIQSMQSNEFPWLAFLYFDNSDADIVWCSGSLIGTKWILTAASCLDVYRKSNQLYGFIGDHNADMRIISPNRISINNLIDDVFIHPQWDQTTRIADIALVRLKADVPFNDYVSPVCLQNSAADNFDLDDASVDLAGWGTVYKGESESTRTFLPRRATAKIVSNSECDGPTNNTTMSGYICVVGDPSGSSCVAEPGGPVIYKNALGTWTAIGIVSYDFNPFIQGTAESFLDYCRTDPSTPKAFTRISSYFDWICSMTNDCSLTTEFTPLSTGQTYPSATDPSTDSSNFTSADSIPSTHTQSRSSSATPNPDQRLNSADPKPVTVPFGLCGRANGQGANPIYREIQTMTSHEFPWLAFFYFGNSFEDKVWCTGSIIGPKWIMTAASCVDQNRNNGKLHGFIGVHNIDPSLSIVPPQRKSIDNIIDTFFLHPQWNEATLNADIALIRLNRTIAYTDYTSPICLPNSTYSVLPTNGTITLAGWGGTGYEGDELVINYMPRKAPVRIVSNSQCLQLNNATTINNICMVGDPSGSSCVGDQGGPVNFKNADNSWTAIGIVSYGYFLGDCQTDSTIPRPFTRVSSYLNWIECIMSDGKLNNSSCSINKSITTIKSSLTSTQSATNISQPTESESITNSSMISSQTSATTQKNFGVCGIANGPGADPSIGTIQSMTDNEFPWQAFLYFTNTLQGVNIWCAGSLIGPKWILTTATCLDIYRKGDIMGFIGVKGKKIFAINNLVDKFVLHPQWNRTTRNADIALIRLKIDVPYTTYISPVCLPNSPDPISGPVTLAGWGQAYDDNKDTNSRKATATIVSHLQCESTNNATTSGNICIIGNPSGSSCVGEPGGSVNYKNPDGTWSTVGIVSYKFFLDCQNSPASTPRSFIRVSSYLDWIACTMSDDKLNCSSTTSTDSTTDTAVISLSTQQTTTSKSSPFFSLPTPTTTLSDATSSSNLNSDQSFTLLSTQSLTNSSNSYSITSPSLIITVSATTTANISLSTDSSIIFTSTISSSATNTSSNNSVLATTQSLASTNYTTTPNSIITDTPRSTIVTTPTTPATVSVTITNPITTASSSGSTAITATLRVSTSTEPFRGCDDSANSNVISFVTIIAALTLSIFIF